MKAYSSLFLPSRVVFSFCEVTSDSNQHTLILYV